VPEVYAGGKWQMYDPALQAYYYNLSGQPASVKELTENNRLILAPTKKIQLSESNNIPVHVLDSLRYGMGVCRYYLSSKDHFENSTYYQTFEVTRFEMQIPAGSELVLPVYEPLLMKQTDWFNNHRKNNYYLKLVLPAGTTGVINIPLVLVAVDGVATAHTSHGNKQVYHFTGRNKEPLQIIDTALSIAVDHKSTSLYYKLPEKFKDRVSLSISGSPQIVSSISQD
jgi:hypothetical protein